MESLEAAPPVPRTLYQITAQMIRSEQIPLARAEELLSDQMIFAKWFRDEFEGVG